jgi:hypothetical protein
VKAHLVLRTTAYGPGNVVRRLLFSQISHHPVQRSIEAALVVVGQMLAIQNANECRSTGDPLERLMQGLELQEEALGISDDILIVWSPSPSPKVSQLLDLQLGRFYHVLPKPKQRSRQISYKAHLNNHLHPYTIVLKPMRARPGYKREESIDTSIRSRFRVSLHTQLMHSGPSRLL